MPALADNGYGDLVSIANPYGQTTTVFYKGAHLERYESDTPHHDVAIHQLRMHLGHIQLYAKRGRWDHGPVLALIPGGAK